MAIDGIQDGCDRIIVVGVRLGRDAFGIEATGGVSKFDSACSTTAI